MSDSVIVPRDRTLVTIDSFYKTRKYEEQIKWQIVKTGWISWNELFIPGIWLDHPDYHLVIRVMLDGWIVIQLCEEIESILGSQQQSDKNYRQEIKTDEEKRQINSSSGTSFQELQKELSKYQLYIGKYGKEHIIDLLPEHEDQYEGEKWRYFVEQGYETVLQFTSKEKLTYQSGQEIKKEILAIANFKPSLTTEIIEKNIWEKITREKEEKNTYKKIIENIPELTGFKEHNIAKYYWDLEGIGHKLRNKDFRIRILRDHIIGHLVYARGTILGVKYNNRYLFYNIKELQRKNLVNNEEGFI